MAIGLTIGEDKLKNTKFAGHLPGKRKNLSVFRHSSKIIFNYLVILSRDQEDLILYETSSKMVIYDHFYTSV